MDKPSRWWIGTIPSADFFPVGPLQQAVRYVKGQLEIGAGGYSHYQVVTNLVKPSRLAALKKLFGSTGHWEPTRSEAAVDYVWKDETAVPETRFELGQKPVHRNDAKDWDEIRAAARKGDLETIPSDVFVRHYSSLKRIAADYATPVAVEREVVVFWGRTGTGKSRRAWEEAGGGTYAKLGSYAKDPCTKWWCGYRGQANVVIDEFRGILCNLGQIGISHLLRWFDRYPVCVETKGSSVPLQTTRFWITSNQSPDEWYPDLDEPTRDALRRRLVVHHFN